MLGSLLQFLERTGDDPSEFVGYVEMPAYELRETLIERDFENLGGGEWRLVESGEQLHVVLYSGISFDGEMEDTYIFAHWEAHPESHPIDFIRGNRRNVSKGVNEMRRHLNLASIPYHNDPTLQ